MGKKWRGSLVQVVVVVPLVVNKGNGTATVSRLPPIPALISISAQALNSFTDSRCRKPVVAAQLLPRTTKMEVEERYSTPLLCPRSRPISRANQVRSRWSKRLSRALPYLRPLNLSSTNSLAPRRRPPPGILLPAAPISTRDQKRLRLPTIRPSH